MGSHSHYKLHRVRKENKVDIYTGTVHMVKTLASGCTATSDKINFELYTALNNLCEMKQIVKRFP